MMILDTYRVRSHYFSSPKEGLLNVSNLIRVVSVQLHR